MPHPERPMVMRPALAFFAAAILVAGGGCSNTSFEVTGVDGQYTYRATTLQGTELVSGQMTLEVVPPTATGQLPQVEGTWSTTAAPGIEEGDVGPQLGEGTLIGEVRTGEIGLNLNPTVADNNVILIGELLGNSISGTWSHLTLEGEANTGRFELLKQ